MGNSLSSYFNAQGIEDDAAPTQNRNTDVRSNKFAKAGVLIY